MSDRPRLVARQIIVDHVGRNLDEKDKAILDRLNRGIEKKWSSVFVSEAKALEKLKAARTAQDALEMHINKWDGLSDSDYLGIVRKILGEEASDALVNVYGQEQLIETLVEKGSAPDLVRQCINEAAAHGVRNEQRRVRMKKILNLARACFGEQFDKGQKLRFFIDKALSDRPEATKAKYPDVKLDW